jgi:hypothetical protein
MFYILNIHGSPQYLNQINLTIVKLNTSPSAEPSTNDVTNPLLPTYNPLPQKQTQSFEN